MTMWFGGIMVEFLGDNIMRDIWVPFTRSDGRLFEEMARPRDMDQTKYGVRQ